MPYTLLDCDVSMCLQGFVFIRVTHIASHSLHSCVLIYIRIGDWRQVRNSGVMCAFMHFLVARCLRCDVRRLAYKYIYIHVYIHTHTCFNMPALKRKLTCCFNVLGSNMIRMFKVLSWHLGSVACPQLFTSANVLSMDRGMDGGFLKAPTRNI